MKIFKKSLFQNPNLLLWLLFGKRKTYKVQQVQTLWFVKWEKNKGILETCGELYSS